jgi:putative endonuclease
MSIYHVYILASASGVLYIGVTNHIERRTAQHKAKLCPGFTAKYDVTRLVYLEAYGDIRAAIGREKQLKNWRREKKIALILSQNPKFKDLSQGFHRSTPQQARASDRQSSLPTCCPDPSTPRLQKS